MSKVKKVFAIIVSMAMILGMSLTTFAEPAGTTIVVNNLDEQAFLTAVQVIEPDTTKETGWKFSSTDAEQAYATAFEKEDYTDDDLQDIIWSLIYYKTNDASKVPAGTEKATAEQIKNALADLDDNSYVSQGTTFEVVSGGVNVTTAGVYAIKATTTAQNYVYSDMAAYVSFDKYVNGEPTELKADPVNAKRTELSIDKDNDKPDDVVAVGDTVTYNITTTVPYIDDAVADVKYTIKDTIKGAEYVTETINDKEYVILTVYLGSTVYPDYRAEVTKTSDGETFTLDLSNIAKYRINANETLEIYYQANVTKTYVENKVDADDGTHDFTEKTDKLYTGSVTITKRDAEDKQTLANAEFKLYRESDGKYAIVEADASAVDTYIVTGWGTKDEAKVNIKTGTNGTAVVKGLDDSDTYKFEEVVAPDGYSINETDSPVNWTNKENPETASDRNGTATMTDTKLAALPSTGGIGTTIFTVGGCAIMIAAAGLYFASRRRQENK